MNDALGDGIEDKGLIILLLPAEGTLIVVHVGRLQAL